ncbi:MAG: PVC-type heme-binding CxxCH protein [Planctomycetota bacterium]
MKSFLFGKSFLLVIFFAFSIFCPVAFGQETPAPDEPQVVGASDEGIQAIETFVWPKDELAIELFAAEPDVANPVAFFVDERGRVYVCETFRQSRGVEDNRSHGNWLNDDLAAQTVEDRIAYIRRYIEDADRRYTQHDDRIRLVEDTDGDGRADTSTVFADRFNAIEMGTGAGVLALGENVYYTSIPDLFLLKDKDGDGVADSRDSLHSGYGVRFAFRGHDMHGLIVGPDGRLYFSIGDRGYNVVTADGRLKDPASGAVFRCELDGSDLQVIATGLRNPQELAFDDYGNLFTGDNNSDSGDKARWVFVAPGGDSGWRMYYQYLPDRGPFNQEKIWQPYSESTPAYIVPPVANITDGPSGLTYYPGTGMSDFFKDRFFICDFRGNATVSGVRTFRCNRKGAFWEVADMDQTFWQILPTDVDFGPDGRLYISDWVFGWGGENKGRIYTFEDESRAEERRQVFELLNDFPEESDALVPLLAHADRRVRQKAQFAIAALENGEEVFLDSIGKAENLFSDLHALWGLGQIYRRTGAKISDDKFNKIARTSSYSSPDFRAQLASLIGETRSNEIEFVLREYIYNDEDLRVKYAAGMAMAQVGYDLSIQAVVKLIEDNSGNDPMLRHAGAMALAGILARLEPVPRQAMMAGTLSSSSDFRLAFVVALRKLHRPDSILYCVTREEAAAVCEQLDIGEFLLDEDPRVVLEAARAVHDLPVTDAMEELASCLGRVASTNSESDQIGLGDAFVRRALNANFRVGLPENARRLAAFAADETQDPARRIDALKMLGEWASPSPKDWLLGDWRPLENRDASHAREALEEYFEPITSSRRLNVLNAAIESAGRLGLTTTVASFEKLLLDDEVNAQTRTAVLLSLAEMNHVGLDELIRKLKPAIEETDGEFAGTVCQVAAQIDEALAMELIQSLLEADDPGANRVRTQMAIEALGQMAGEESGTKLLELITGIRGSVAEIRLDIVNAARNREAEFSEPLQALAAELADEEDPSAVYEFTLFGGDADRGRDIFRNKTEVSCLRCHMVNGNGGEVGPDLSGIALTRDREYLLDSIVNPNKDIADGFTQQIILTIDGDTLTGIVTDSVDGRLRLVDKDANVTWIAEEDIEGRKQGKSSMPEDLVNSLTETEIRDLIEYLAGCNSEPAPRQNSESHGSEEHGADENVAEEHGG